MGFFHEAESWVLVAFLLFIALLVYLKVPGKLGAMLDERAAKIAKDLEEARKLRDEAQKILAEYEKRRSEGVKEAANIVAQAKVDAQEFAAESRRKLDEMLARLSQQAEQKISQAEAAALKEVRNTAAEIAAKAAAALLGDAAKGGKGAALIEQSIAAVKTRLN